MKQFFLLTVFILPLLVLPGRGYGQQELLAYWRFEKLQDSKGNITIPTLGQTAIADDQKLADLQYFAFDDSGKSNFLQLGSKPSSVTYSENLPFASSNGVVNTHYLSIKKKEYRVSFDRTLAYYNMQKSWKIEASLMCNLLGTEQVYLCKEGVKGALTGDVSIGFDPMAVKYFVEVVCADGVPRRITVGDEVLAGKWYDIKAEANYDLKTGLTKLTLSIKPSNQNDSWDVGSISFKGFALNSGAKMWVIGRGFPGGYPNSLAVLDGGIDEVRIYGEALQKVKGQNPIFTDSFTADPTALVDGGKVYVYVGQDAAAPGAWFNMPNWLCYSTTDMINWKAHGPVLAARDFAGANPGSSWAAQVVKNDGKYFFYATLDGKNGHFITVAEGDNPLGPFKEINPQKPLVIDSMTRDSYRPNADIDPTVIIDDDGTPWMAWGNGDCYMVKLKKNMTELDGELKKVPFRNYSEGPWLFKRNQLYYNIYAADVPGVQAEQICYSTATKITGPWTYRGLITGPAKHGFTIHPAVIEFKNQWYFFYHDGSYLRDGEPGGDTRRSVCVEYLNFNQDGSIRPIELTNKGISSILKNK